MDEKADYRFPKEARLHHRSLVEGLFRLGKSYYEFPFRISWRTLSPEELQRNFRSNVPEGIGKVQMMVTVPKKKRRRAVDRVLMRRRIRESFRLNRRGLCLRIDELPEIATLSLAFVYIHDKNLPYVTVEEKMRAALSKLQSKL